MSLVDDATEPTGPTTVRRRPPPRRGGGIRWGRVGAAVAVVVGLLVLAIVGISHALKTASPPLVAMCTVTTSDGTYTLTPDQASDAAAIAAVGHSLGLPDHAVTIALATSLQETKLLNLPYGDRDSLGLFQQRPSEGWGTPTQLMQPVYASTAFYQALEQVQGWQTMEVAQAAQAVQRSADPTAYAVQEPEARSLAVALTGESPAAFACHAASSSTAAVSSKWPATLATQLGNLVPASTGSAGVSATAGTQVDAATGWILASWLVANAPQYGFHTVSFAGQTWTLARGTWKPGGPADGVVHLA